MGIYILELVQKIRNLHALCTSIRMLLSGKESLPDDESHDLVIGMLFLTGKNDEAMKLMDMALKSSYMLSTTVFSDCVRSCVAKGRTDTLVSIIERCKVLMSFCCLWLILKLFLSLLLIVIVFLFCRLLIGTSPYVLAGYCVLIWQKLQFKRIIAN